MTNTAIFDVNETLLELRALDPLFLAWFGSTVPRSEWFQQTLHLAMTLSATRAYHPFGDVGSAALATIASRHAATLPRDATMHLGRELRRLPPHDDVLPALRRLRDAGFRTAALSNNARSLLREQLHNAGISEWIDEIMSVDEAGALKPSPEVYQFALGRMASPAETTWMVAAHGWDIAGATRVGLRGAFVARPGQSPDPFAPPEISGSDLNEVVEAIIAASRAGSKGTVVKTS